MDERVKSFFKGLFVMAFWTLLVWWAWSTVSEDYRLSVMGNKLLAELSAICPKHARQGGRGHTHITTIHSLTRATTRDAIWGDNIP
jgi:hypothetical protein